MNWKEHQLKRRNLPYRRFLKSVCLDLNDTPDNIKYFLEELGINIDVKSINFLQSEIKSKYGKYLKNKKQKIEIYKKLNVYEYYLYENEGYDLFSDVLYLQKDQNLRLTVQSAILLQDPSFVTDVLSVPPDTEVLNLYEKYFFDLENIQFGDMLVYLGTLPAVESLILRSALSGDKDQALSVILSQLQGGVIKPIKTDIDKARSYAYLNLINEMNKGKYLDLRKVKHFSNIFFKAVLAEDKISKKSQVSSAEEELPKLEFADLDFTKDGRFMPLKKVESSK